MRLVIVLVLLALVGAVDARRKFHAPTHRVRTAIPSVQPTSHPTLQPSPSPSAVEYERPPPPFEYETNATIAPTYTPTESPTPNPTTTGTAEGERCYADDRCVQGLECTSYGICVNRAACHVLCHSRTRATCLKPSPAVPGCECRRVKNTLCADAP